MYLVDIKHRIEFTTWLQDSETSVLFLPDFSDRKNTKQKITMNLARFERTTYIY